MQLSDIDSGDVLLYKGTGIVSRAIEYLGRCVYSHVGIVLKDPTFLPEKGLYVLHSSNEPFPDAENGKEKFGVRIDRLETLIENDKKTGCFYVRKLSFNRDDEFNTKLAEIHSTIHDRPYDTKLQHWILAKLMVDGFDIQALRKWCTSDTTDTFWCSALACYVYFKLGLLHNTYIDWTYISPSEFTKTGNRFLHFKYAIGDEVPLIASVNKHVVGKFGLPLLF